MCLSRYFDEYDEAYDHETKCDGKGGERSDDGGVGVDISGGIGDHSGENVEGVTKTVMGGEVSVGADVGVEVEVGDDANNAKTALGPFVALLPRPEDCPGLSEYATLLLSSVVFFELGEDNTAAGRTVVGTSLSSDGVQRTPQSAPYPLSRRLPGFVGLRCRHCQHLANDQSRRAFAFPGSIQSLPSSIYKFAGCHFSECPALPGSFRSDFRSSRFGSGPFRGGESIKTYVTRMAPSWGLVDVLAQTADGVVRGLAFRSSLDRFKDKFLEVPELPPKCVQGGGAKGGGGRKRQPVRRKKRPGAVPEAPPDDEEAADDDASVGGDGGTADEKGESATSSSSAGGEAKRKRAEISNNRVDPYPKRERKSISQWADGVPVDVMNSFTMDDEELLGAAYGIRRKRVRANDESLSGGGGGEKIRHRSKSAGGAKPASRGRFPFSSAVPAVVDYDDVPEENLVIGAGSDGSEGYEFGLAIPGEDEENLSELQCYIRSKCVEAFVVTQSDAEEAQYGRGGQVEAGQVGIRCIHCGLTAGRRGSAQFIAGACTFPSSTLQLYEGVTRIIWRHLDACELTPLSVKATVARLKVEGIVRSQNPRQYFHGSARKMGIVNTLAGIRLDRQRHEKWLEELDRRLQEGDRDEESLVEVDERTYPDLPLSLGLPSDKQSMTPLHRLARSFLDIFHIYDDEDANLYTRRCRTAIKIGQVGLRCTFCYNKENQGGKFKFPTSIDDVYGQVRHFIYDHFPNCSALPKHHKAAYFDARTNKTSKTDVKEIYRWSALEIGLFNLPDKGIGYAQRL